MNGRTVILATLALLGLATASQSEQNSSMNSKQNELRNDFNMSAISILYHLNERAASLERQQRELLELKAELDQLIKQPNLSFKDFKELSEMRKSNTLSQKNLIKDQQSLQEQLSQLAAIVNAQSETTHESKKVNGSISDGQNEH